MLRTLTTENPNQSHILDLPVKPFLTVQNLSQTFLQTIIPTELIIGNLNAQSQVQPLHILISPYFCKLYDLSMTHVIVTPKQQHKSTSHKRSIRGVSREIKLRLCASFSRRDRQLLLCVNIFEPMHVTYVLVTFPCDQSLRSRHLPLICKNQAQNKKLTLE